MDSPALPAAPRALPMAGGQIQTPFPENTLPLRGEKRVAAGGEEPVGGPDEIKRRDRCEPPLLAKTDIHVSCRPRCRRSGSGPRRPRRGRRGSCSTDGRRVAGIGIGVARYGRSFRRRRGPPPWQQARPRQLRQFASAWSVVRFARDIWIALGAGRTPGRQVLPGGWFLRAATSIAIGPDDV